MIAKTIRGVLLANIAAASRLIADGANVYLGVGAEFAEHGATDQVQNYIHSNTA